MFLRYISNTSQKQNWRLLSMILLRRLCLWSLYLAWAVS